MGDWWSRALTLIGQRALLGEALDNPLAEPEATG